MNSLIDLLLLHSPLITNIVQGYENDSKQIDNLLTLVFKDLNKERIMTILNGNFLCTPDEIEQIWNFMYKYDIDIKDNFREYCIKKIYKELNYKLNITDTTTSIIALINNTCINDDEKCIDCKTTAKKGHLECLKYAHENGCEWNSDTCANAALNGQIECLKYAHENGCEWDDNTCTNAAENGQIECLKYAHENGCKWNDDNYTWKLNGNACANAAQNGQIECLKYAHENGCGLYYDTCANAAQNGQIECLKYAHENGCRWYYDTCLNAAKNGHLECLKYAHENGCEWTSYKSAYSDHLKCLNYLKNSDTCLNALEKRQLEK
jgi:hypothetical protein